MIRTQGKEKIHFQLISREQYYLVEYTTKSDCSNGSANVEKAFR